MKKSVNNKLRIVMTLLLALTMCMPSFVVPGDVWAGNTETVTIGSASAKSDWLPHRTNWKYSRTQIVYDSDLIGKDGQIVSMAYNVATPSQGYRLSNMRVWMGYTNQDFFNYNSGVNDLIRDDVVKVYDGKPDIGTEKGWYTIDFDEPFDYDHINGNLVVITSVSVAHKGDETLEYYCAINGDGFVRDAISALEIDSEDDIAVTDLNYSGSAPVRVRSSVPDIKLSFDTSQGGDNSSFKVDFDTDGGAPVPETQTISKGGKVTQPEAPQREGYRFEGWHKGSSKYDFDSTVKMSFTLKAKWVKVHRIIFLGDNGAELQNSLIDDGEKPEYEGEEPVKSSSDGKEYVFAGWDPAIKEADSDQTYTAVFADKAELADKTALNAEIKKATDARTGVRPSDDGKDVGKKFQYVTNAEWQAYDSALTSAQAVADKPLAKQPEVDDALSDLIAAEADFQAAKKQGQKTTLPAITEIVISKESGRLQPAVGGNYEWKVTFEKWSGNEEDPKPDYSTITEDDFQIQRKPSGQEWKNSKCPYVGFRLSTREGEENIGYLTGMAIPDNTKAGDTTNLWRFIYAGYTAENVECPVITQAGYVFIDKAELKAAIKDAEDAQKDVKVSDNGWNVSPSDMFVTPAEKQEHDDAIAEAKAVDEADENERVTQNDVDAAATKLREATQKFIKAKKGGNGEDEEAGYLQGDYRLIYETEKVGMPAIPVREYSEEDGGDESAKWFTEKPLSFKLYDTTLQEDAGTYTTEEGSYKDEDGAEHKAQMLSGVELIRGHRYIVSVNDADYAIPAYYTVTISDDGNGNANTYTASMANYYISLSEDGGQPKDIKNDAAFKYIEVIKRDSALEDTEDARRVNVRIPVYYTGDKGIISAVKDAIIKLISPSETLYITSDANGEISAALIEDENYMVQLVDDSGALGITMFPLVVKDHAENGWPKSIYNHFSCGSVQGLYIVDKQYEHAKDTTLKATSGKTSVTGMNFLNNSETNTDRFFINDRQLDNSSVTGLDGWDYEVFRVDAINMFRTELSRLAAGTYEITREVPAGREVERVYYVNAKGKLRSLKFAQSGSKVTYTMSTLSMYPNVVVYKPAASSSAAGQSGKSGATATVNKSTVNAAAVKAAIASSGGKATEFVIGKNVKKISKGAFKGTGVKTLVVKSKKLKKKSVKGSLKGSKVKTVKVKVGKAKTNKKYVKKYKKIFTKKNAGKKVKVKR